MKKGQVFLTRTGKEYEVRVQEWCVLDGQNLNDLIYTNDEKLIKIK